MRYNTLYEFHEEQYVEGAPLILSAGALLKDMQTNKLIAQLKFRSISKTTIKAVKVELILFEIGMKYLVKKHPFRLPSQLPEAFRL